MKGTPTVPLVGPRADGMASEAECADVIAGDGELLHGERTAAEVVDGVKGAYDADVVSGPDVGRRRGR